MRAQSNLRAPAAALCAALCATLFLPASGLAKRADAIDAVSDAEAIEVERDATDLRRRLDERHLDVDRFDTALVFTNVHGAQWARVKCAGYDDDGHYVGAARTRISPNGLRYLLASDIANGRDFIGSVVCRASRPVLVSAVLIGAQLTDLRAIQRSTPGPLIRFPLVVSY